MLTLLDGNITKVIPIGDPKEGVTVTIGMIAATARNHIMNLFREDRSNNLGRLELARFGIRSWSGFAAPDGMVVLPKFESFLIPGTSQPIQGLSEASLSAVPDWIVRRLTVPLVELNFPTEDTEKNSAAPSTPSDTPRS